MNKLKTILLAMAGTTITLLPVAATVACKYENEEKKPADNNNGGTTTPTPVAKPETGSKPETGAKPETGSQTGDSTVPSTGSASGEAKTSAIAEAAKSLALKVDDKYLNNDNYRSYLNASAYSSLYYKVGVTGMDTAKYDVKIKDFAIDNANGKVAFNVEATDKTDKSQTVTKALELTGFRPTTAEELAKVNNKEVQITPVTNQEDINTFFNSKPKYIGYYFSTSKLNAKKSEYYDLSEQIFADKGSFQLCEADNVLFENNKKKTNPSSRLMIKAIDPAQKTITFTYRIVNVIKVPKAHYQYVISDPKEMTLSFVAKETSENAVA
ncbi:hypothetical protein [Mycoplasma sp. Z473B]|uniref:hypothetical protein n=1 Tax=Mycoplasma sp. Z473B TaxID=3401667 RepID=UPI003AAF937B